MLAVGVSFQSVKFLHSIFEKESRIALILTHFHSKNIIFRRKLLELHIVERMQCNLFTVFIAQFLHIYRIIYL